MKKLSPWFAPLVALVLALPAQAITGGQPTTAFPFVGIGVQVAPDWVLTVRHAALGPGSTYENGYGARTVAGVYFADTADFPANDFALLHLVPAAQPVAGTMYPGVLSTVLVHGGFQPLAATAVSPSNHTPRGMGMMTISDAIATYDDDGPGPLPAVPTNWVVSYDTHVMLENGDSGGGLFLDTQFGIGTLFGLASTLITDDNNVNIASAFVQPAAYRSWIDGIMEGELSDDQHVNWVTSPSVVPEPAAWALLLGGGLLVLHARRRRVS